MRAAADDLLQGFRFHVTASNEAGVDPLKYTALGTGGFPAQAGFTAVTVPEITTEAVEYREGIFVWTQKYPGPPTVSDCTLTRGVSKGDTVFYDWVMGAVKGERYRADITILHYQRAEMDSAASAGPSARDYQCKNAFGTRVKAAGDMDATSGEVSLSEVDFALEELLIVVDTTVFPASPGI